MAKAWPAQKVRQKIPYRYQGLALTFAVNVEF